MKMQSKAVGRLGIRRFATAAAGAACRRKTFCILMLVRAEDCHTAARWSTVTTSDRELRRDCVVYAFLMRWLQRGRGAVVVTAKAARKFRAKQEFAVQGRKGGNEVGA